MTIPSKGARAIVVGDVRYRFRVSRWRRLSAWSPASVGLVDPRWLAYARRFGLGDVADVAFTIAIERAQAPASTLVARYHAKIIDGFLGPEQLTAVTPSLVRQILERAIEDGWRPGARGDQRVDLVENSGDPRRPVLMVLPGIASDLDGYEKKLVPLRIA